MIFIVAVKFSSFGLKKSCVSKILSRVVVTRSTSDRFGVRLQSPIQITEPNTVEVFSKQLVFAC